MDLLALLEFKPEISDLPIQIKERLDLIESRSDLEIKEALRLLDETKRLERIKMLKGDYLVDLLCNQLLIELNEDEVNFLQTLDNSSFNNYKNQGKFFEIVKKYEISIKVFNRISDIKFNILSYVDFMLKQMLNANEEVWCSSLYQRALVTKSMSEKKAFAETLIKYQQYEFDVIETIDYDFDAKELYFSDKFLIFDSTAEIVDLAEIYALNLSKFRELLNEKSIDSSRIESMLNYPSQKSLMYLGEFELLLRRYQSFIGEKEEKRTDEIPDDLVIAYHESVTKCVEVSDSSKDPTGTKLDIVKTGNSKSVTGVKAERIVYKFLTGQVGISNLKWDSENAPASINPNGRAGLGYDIKYTKDECTYFIKV